jgi:hypothetical protein
LLTIPAGLVILVGFLLDEPRMENFSYRQVYKGPFELNYLSLSTSIITCKTVWSSLWK